MTYLFLVEIKIIIQSGTRVIADMPDIQQPTTYTPSIAFRHLPPNSRIRYATEGALYLCAVVHRRCQRPPKGLSTNKTVEAT